MTAELDMALRKVTLGPSDFATILGLDPWKQPRDLAAQLGRVAQRELAFRETLVQGLTVDELHDEV